MEWLESFKLKLSKWWDRAFGKKSYNLDKGSVKKFEVNGKKDDKDKQELVSKDKLQKFPDNLNELLKKDMDKLTKDHVKKLKEEDIRKAAEYYRRIRHIYDTKLDKRHADLIYLECYSFYIVMKKVIDLSQLNIKLTSVEKKKGPSVVNIGDNEKRSYTNFADWKWLWKKKFFAWKNLWGKTPSEDKYNNGKFSK